MNTVRFTSPRVVLLAACVACGAAAPAGAAGGTVSSWRAEAGGRVNYDSNIFLQDGGPAVAGVVSPGEPAKAGTWVGTLSAGAGYSSAETPAGRFTFDYHVDAVRFDDYSSENHDDHRLRVGLKGGADHWKWTASAGVLHTDGSDEGPVYRRVGGGPAIGGEPVRARRDQTISTGSFRATREVEGGWWRVLGDAKYQDFHTKFDALAGLSPYVDRGEFTAGVEAGRDVAPGFALVAGVRAGVQKQEDRPPIEGRNSSNSILRALVGVEGKPTKTLKLDVRVGPDFRHFGDELPSSLDRDVTAPYGELAATWTPTEADSVTASGKYAIWLSSAGRGAYEDSIWKLAWSHRFSAVVTARIEGRLATGDSKGYAYPGVKAFNDRIYGGTLGVDFAVAKDTTVSLDAIGDVGDSLIPDRPGREYHRVQVGLGVTRVW